MEVSEREDAVQEFQFVHKMFGLLMLRELFKGKQWPLPTGKPVVWDFANVALTDGQDCDVGKIWNRSKFIQSV